jgi:hypothetical protein
VAIVPSRIDRGAFRHRATRRTAWLEYSGGSPCCSLAPGRGHAVTALKFFFTDDPGPWAVISHKPTSLREHPPRREFRPFPKFLGGPLRSLV